MALATGCRSGLECWAGGRQRHRLKLQCVRQAKLHHSAAAIALVCWGPLAEWPMALLLACGECHWVVTCAGTMSVRVSGGGVPVARRHEDSGADECDSSGSSSMLQATRQQYSSVFVGPNPRAQQVSCKPGGSGA
jgi:hypothetical protein